MNKEKIDFILMALLVLVSALLLVALITRKDPNVKDPNSSTIDAMVKMVNAEREANGLPDLDENILLDKSATAKACDMNTKNYFSHISPDGTTPWQFIKKTGYNFQFAGENMTRGYNNDEERMDSFMKSKDHRENILNKDYKEIGIGRCGFYVVQHFGTK